MSIITDRYKNQKAKIIIFCTQKNNCQFLFFSDDGWYVTSCGRTPNYSAYLCPFCIRSYTGWGYRRRHIKSVHSNGDEISCRWCPNETFVQKHWIKHVADKHELSEKEAKQAIYILDEAVKVLDMKNDRPVISGSLVQDKSKKGKQKEQDVNPF